MSPTMMLHFAPPAGLQAPSPGPVLSSNTTSDGVVLAANASESIMIVALPAAIIVAILAIVIVLSYARLPQRLFHPAQQLEAGHLPGKAEAPLEPLFREMPVVLLQQDQQILIGKRVPLPSLQQSPPTANQEIYIVVIQP